MAIAFVSSTAKIADNINSVTSAGIDTTSANLIIISGSTATVGPTVNCSDSYGNTWTAISEIVGGSRGLRVWYCLNPTVGAGHTFTLSGTAIYTGIRVQAFSGVDTAAGIDQTNSAGVGTGGTSYQPGSITPTTGGSLIVSAVLATGTSFSVNSGLSAVASDYVGGASIGGAQGYLVQPTAAAINPTWSWTSSSVRAAWIASFKPLVPSRILDDIVCYFPLHEPSGNVVDRINGLVGVETGGTIASAAGRVVGARDFGVSKYFEVSDHSAISGGNFDYTIAYWAKPNSVTGVQVAAAKGWQATNDVNREWVSYLNGTSSVWTPQRGTSIGDTTVASAATIGAWSFYLQSVRASDGLRSNRVNNGTAVTGTLATTGGGNDGNRSLYIGASPAQSLWFNGSLCEFAMWRRLLSDDEQTFLFRGRSYPFPTMFPQALVI